MRAKLQGKFVRAKLLSMAVLEEREHLLEVTNLQVMAESMAFTA